MTTYSEICLRTLASIVPICDFAVAVNRSISAFPSVKIPLLTLTAVAYFGEIYGSWRAAKYYQKVKTAEAN